VPGLDSRDKEIRKLLPVSAFKKNHHFTHILISTLQTMPMLLSTHSNVPTFHLSQCGILISKRFRARAYRAPSSAVSLITIRDIAPQTISRARSVRHLTPLFTADIFFSVCFGNA
jgi:hypothetical protein